MPPRLTLKPGREKSILRRHPWIFSGAVAHVEGDPRPGETVDMCSSRGELLARGAFSPSSQIQARIWTFDPREQVDVPFFRRRISDAIQVRSSLLEKNPGIPPVQAAPDHRSALRLIHAESDGLPGLIVDRYGDLLVAQFLTAGAELWHEQFADLLLEQAGMQSLYERSDADVRELEGLEPRCGWLRPLTRAAAPGSAPTTTTITENGLQFLVDFKSGHKTGFYLDQQQNRQQVRSLSSGREVLDCFCYTGGFTVSALAGGAKSVLSVDSSSDALALCQENVRLNGLSSMDHTLLEGDVFQLLRKFRDESRQFDLIVLDPPKFAPTASQAAKAARGYKDINLLGFKLLRPGGLLVTFSCSGGVDAALFQKIIASAALDAGIEAQILMHLSQAPDHPVALSFPEGAYLKGLICRKV